MTYGEAIDSTKGVLVSFQEGPKDPIHEGDEQHVSMMIDKETKKWRKCVPTLHPIFGTHTMMDQSFVIKTLDTKEMMGFHELTASKGSTLDCEILQKVGDEEEYGGVAPTSPYHDTSTQQSEMDLRSGSNHNKFPSIVHMEMSHKTPLSCDIPHGSPPNSYLMKYFSCIDAPFIDPRREGAL